MYVPAILYHNVSMMSISCRSDGVHQKPSSRRSLQMLTHLQISPSSRRSLQTLTHLQIPPSSRRSLQMLAHLQISLSPDSVWSSPGGRAKKEGKRRSAFYVFSKTVQTKTGAEIPLLLSDDVICRNLITEVSFACFSFQKQFKQKQERKPTPVFR